MSTITLNELANYNSGKLVCQEFDLDFINQEEYQEKISEWLESLPAVQGYPCEEYCIGDAEGLVHLFVSDYSIDSNYWEYAELIDNGMDEDMVEAGYNVGIPAAKIADAYIGEFRSDEDFAKYHAEECGIDLDGLAWPQNHINWEGAARDLMCDYIEMDGHYFSNQW